MQEFHPDVEVRATSVYLAPDDLAVHTEGLIGFFEVDDNPDLLNFRLSTSVFNKPPSLPRCQLPQEGQGQEDGDDRYKPAFSLLGCEST